MEEPLETKAKEESFQMNSYYPQTNDNDRRRWISLQAEGSL